MESASSDGAGTFTITSGGAGWQSGAQATITFNKPFTTKAKVTITPASLNAAGRDFYVTSNTTSFTIYFLVAPLSNTAYSYNYMVMDN